MYHSNLNYWRLVIFFFLSVSLLTKTKSYAQYGSGTMKTATGYLCFYSSPNTNFTIRLDEPNSEVPNWFDDKSLQLGKDVLQIQIIDKSEIAKSDIKNEKELLRLLKRWETDYLDSSYNNRDIVRSKFISDSLFYDTKFSNLDLKFSPWYYFVTNKDIRFYFYFFDLYHSNSFIRIEFSGVLFGNNGLDAARQFNSSLVNCFKFYDNKLNIDALKIAVKNGNYSYKEN